MSLNCWYKCLLCESQTFRVSSAVIIFIVVFALVNQKCCYMKIYNYRIFKNEIPLTGRKNISGGLMGHSFMVMPQQFFKCKTFSQHAYILSYSYNHLHRVENPKSITNNSSKNKYERYKEIERANWKIFQQSPKNKYAPYIRNKNWNATTEPKTWNELMWNGEKKSNCKSLFFDWQKYCLSCFLTVIQYVCGSVFDFFTSLLFICLFNDDTREKKNTHSFVHIKSRFIRFLPRHLCRVFSTVPNAF